MAKIRPDGDEKLGVEVTEL